MISRDVQGLDDCLTLSNPSQQENQLIFRTMTFTATNRYPIDFVDFQNPCELFVISCYGRVEVVVERQLLKIAHSQKQRQDYYYRCRFLKSSLSMSLESKVGDFQFDSEAFEERNTLNNGKRCLSWRSSEENLKVTPDKLSF